MPRHPPEPEYRGDMKLRRVRSAGEIKFGGELIHISSALAGEAVALQETERGWRVWFCNEPVGLLDHRGQKLLPIHPG